MGRCGHVAAVKFPVHMVPEPIQYSHSYIAQGQNLNPRQGCAPAGMHLSIIACFFHDPIPIMLIWGYVSFAYVR
jgi:hypothetical protein